MHFEILYNYVVQPLSHVQLFSTPWITATVSSPPLSPGVGSKSYPLGWSCYPTISSKGSVKLYPNSFLWHLETLQPWRGCHSDLWQKRENSVFSLPIEVSGMLPTIQLSSCCCSVTKLCLTLCDLVGCSPPGSSVSGISQARILEWVAVSFSRGSSPPRDQTHVSCISC